MTGSRVRSLLLLSCANVLVSLGWQVGPWDWALFTTTGNISNFSIFPRISDFGIISSSGE